MMTTISFNGRNSILCPQQNAFLNSWERIRDAACLPSIAGLEEATLRQVAEKLMLCQVQREGDDLRFLIKFHGRQFQKVHGRKVVGEFVDETVPPSLRQSALAAYRQVAITGEPNFSSTLLREDDGAIVNYERLLLPFTRTGSIVEYICCVVTMVTEANGFNFDIAFRGRPVHETA